MDVRSWAMSFLVRSNSAWAWERSTAVFWAALAKVGGQGPVRQRKASGAAAASHIHPRITWPPARRGARPTGNSTRLTTRRRWAISAAISI